MPVAKSAVVEVFQYAAAGPEPPTPAWFGLDDALPEASGAVVSKPSASAQGNPGACGHGQLEQHDAEKSRRSFEAGRERGLQEGRKAEHEAQAATRRAAEKQRIEQAAGLVSSFAEERDRFMETIEHEVVKLALAVAARILRREAQMDPLLLTGAVRVALGQLSKTTQVRLRVPQAELDMWTEAIALLPNLDLKPTLLPDKEMHVGDCIVETDLGSVDLGIRSQLGEIEQGFFDKAGASSARTALISGGPLECGLEGRR
jgi:flagellar assembly protein FliH